MRPRAPDNVVAETVEAEVLILGGGLTGLAAGAALGGRAVVLEREARPGGLVRTECFDGYWFDRVIHLLHFQHGPTERRIRTLLGDVLAPCPPTAWVESAAGTARYPVQLHLGGLDPEARARCLADFEAACAAGAPDPDTGYDAYLLQTFGRALCDAFFLPYNRKQWGRDLAGLAPSEMTWNLCRPSLEEVRAGALRPSPLQQAAYNSNAFYPRPPAGAPVRGMEVLTRALAARVPRLHLRTTVEAVDLDARTVYARRWGERVAYRFREACLSTLPLPTAVRLCTDAPGDVRAASRRLVHNTVYSVGVAVRGPRPTGTGHWRYYPDERVPFTRLTFMTEFDPLLAPPEGWGVLAEIPVPAETLPPREADLAAATQEGLRRVGLLGEGCVVVGAHVMVADPAYVVFTRGTGRAVQRCREHLAAGGVSTLGRYGRWEYSSMAQVMRGGFGWAEALSRPARPPAPRRPVRV